MKERPILFSAPMVRALLDGRKTQTRRVVKPQPIYDGRFAGHWKLLGKQGVESSVVSPLLAELCPYGQPGDRLWVRETWQGPLLDQFESDADAEWMNPSRVHQYQNPAHCQYAADGGPAPEFLDVDDNLQRRWRPSIHMPRWASRITLEVTGVRVERLQDIRETDAMAEGVPWANCGPPREGNFAQLWESINGPDSWDANPWVWVVEFKKLEN